MTPGGALSRIPNGPPCLFRRIAVPGDRALSGRYSATYPRRLDLATPLSPGPRFSPPLPLGKRRICHTISVNLLGLNRPICTTIACLYDFVNKVLFKSLHAGKVLAVTISIWEVELDNVSPNGGNKLFGSLNIFIATT